MDSSEQGANRVNMKQANRVVSGRGQKVTYGRIIPASMTISGRYVKKIAHCFDKPPDLGQIQDEEIYEVKPDGSIRHINY